MARGSGGGPDAGGWPRSAARVKPGGVEKDSGAGVWGSSTGGGAARGLEVLLHHHMRLDIPISDDGGNRDLPGGKHD
jgi:hypothetical protein